MQNVIEKLLGSDGTCGSVQGKGQCPGPGVGIGPGCGCERGDKVFPSGACPPV